MGFFKLITVCTPDSTSPLCPQASSGHSLGTCAGIGVGVGVGLVFLLQGFRRVRRRHALEHGALTEQLLATEHQCMELELEGVDVSWLSLL